eukprot:CAMPEP_0169453520 /NCGR_PEP_ID=MMETSP1042-20121227/14802_1 /TAXON_ID=464988 /ORGANISM="Hemiselmis andersenii, Strain CCMP1180" /LENGTH=122 /DNA_ID=CAMNT_0009565559 /DNA_START=45 /DNA_END=413 /DNA_ORIENTATION=-
MSDVRVMVRVALPLQLHHSPLDPNDAASAPPSGRGDCAVAPAIPAIVIVVASLARRAKLLVRVRVRVFGEETMGCVCAMRTLRRAGTTTNMGRAPSSMPLRFVASYVTSTAGMAVLARSQKP